MGSEQSSTAMKKHDGRHWRIDKWFPELTEDVLQKLQVFHYELIHFNSVLNLISPRTEMDADQVHFADCIIGGKCVLDNTSQQEIYDFGSGNGLPGLVMAAMAPQRKFILIDVDKRKAEFIKHASFRMGLENVKVLSGRVEDLPEGSVGCAVSRGFANIGKSILAARKVAKSKCEYFHFKGDGWVREVAIIPTQLCAFWEPELLKQYELPLNGPRLSIIRTKKSE